MNKAEFQKLVWEKGHELYRDMPWRQDTCPYYVLVSEVMLQQTQVERVVPKFTEFILAFPDIGVLASAPLGEVLRVWQGLGYYRRAKYLHDSAKKIMRDFDGRVPDMAVELVKLPGVGANTAGAILAYAFNYPAVFVETNIRAAYFHHFFSGIDSVSDRELRRVVKETLDLSRPREFYWALMDYGTWLKGAGLARTGQSRHYRRQPKFRGSIREMRGQIIRELATGDIGVACLAARFESDDRFTPALQGLIGDGLVSQTGAMLHLTA